MGPLAGVRIIEMAGIGPGPFCGMMLSDMGADVIRVDRPSAIDLGVDMPRQFNVLNRGRRSIVLDLKTPEGVVAAKRIAGNCDALIEGFRPGVMERLGLAPTNCWLAILAWSTVASPVGDRPDPARPPLATTSIISP